jgi:MoCo/4Fe-4S cofactor protein with predicted Tat translocation signal
MQRNEADPGRDQWRSLEELADDEGFQQLLADEFPQHYFSAEGLDRRRFLQLSAASLALAGTVGCTKQPPEKIVPYVRQPEEIVPGKALWFATSRTLDGYALPLLAESHMGRPTKVEGNPDHPASRGATDLFAQASVLELYDPDRAQALTEVGQLRSWSDFTALIESLGPRLKADQGEGLRILTGAVSSPTLLALLDGLTRSLPAARWHRWEATAGNADAGARLAFGEPVETVYEVADAEVLLALDSDFLTSGPGAVRHARDFASRRRIEGDHPELNRLYAVETTFTNTGVTADHRLAVSPQELAGFALAVAAELGVTGEDETPDDLLSGFSRPETVSWIRAVADDLRAHPGRSLVIAGPTTPAPIHALAHAINEALGNVGSTVRYLEPIAPAPGEGPPAGAASPSAGPSADAGNPTASLAALVEDMRAGRVSTLVILGGNPVFDAPSDLDFAGGLDQVDRRVFLGPYENETSAHCQWMIPETHFLESWGDGRSADGGVCLSQPLIDPLYDSHSAYEILAALDGRSDAKTYELVREYWTSLGVDQATFRRAIHDGFLPGHELAAKTVTVTGAREAARRIAEIWSGRPETGLTLVLRPDPTLHDGRFINNGWLQECPKPVTRLTWDNALLVAPRLAERNRWTNEEVVSVTLPGPEPRSLEVPLWVLPGHPEDTVTLHLGYGRRRTGKIGAGTGVDAYPARTTEHLWEVPGVELSRGAGRVPLASTQDHFSMEGRHQVRVASLDHYRAEPEFARHMEHVPEDDQTLYPPYEYKGYAWGLAVDLNACTGCNACVVACQAENNIPVVGKPNVLNGREMQWIRIDRYFEGSLDDPEAHQQPVMCQQCEMAPCEVVCPVAATVHSDEGLNDMVYNRCVGTRYCSNNCPYKVRRFNFLEYNDHSTPVLKMLRNPDVTLRERGVMEKCTYCVQRINGARQQAKVEGRRVQDGEIVTACQQVCPSGAIVFGDVNDPASEVSRWKDRPTNYQLLGELNTRPRTSYLAKVKNPNPALTS